MSALVWGIKSSLLGYVRGMSDGRVEVADGATEAGDGFRFEALGPLAFRGAVTLHGHGGMLHLRIADPAIARTADGWVLEIADPDDPDIRLPFATIAAFDGELATGTALTEDGADLFFGPYRAGTPVDDPRVDLAAPDAPTDPPRGGRDAA